MPRIKSITLPNALKSSSCAIIVLFLGASLTPPKGYSLYTSLFNKKSFNKRVRYKQNLRDLITKNQ